MTKQRRDRKGAGGGGRNRRRPPPPPREEEEPPQEGEEGEEEGAFPLQRPRSTSQRLMPASFTCPLTGRPFVDPVMDTCAHTFERTAILEWMTKQSQSQQSQSRQSLTTKSKQGTTDAINSDTSLHGCCPISRKPLSARDLVPNHALSERMERWYWMKQTDGIAWDEIGRLPTAATTTSTASTSDTERHEQQQHHEHHHHDLQQSIIAAATVTTTATTDVSTDDSSSIDDDDDDDSYDEIILVEGERNGDGRNSRSLVPMDIETGNRVHRPKQFTKASAGRKKRSRGLLLLRGGPVPAKFALLPQEQKVLEMVQLKRSERSALRRRRRMRRRACVGLFAILVTVGILVGVMKYNQFRRQPSQESQQQPQSQQP